MTDQNNEIFNKDNFSSRGGGVTWACEYGDQSTVCPLLVEDLRSPGQMLIEVAVLKTFTQCLCLELSTKMIISLSKNISRSKELA